MLELATAAAQQWTGTLTRAMLAKDHYWRLTKRVLKGGISLREIAPDLMRSEGLRNKELKKQSPSLENSRSIAFRFLVEPSLNQLANPIEEFPNIIGTFATCDIKRINRAKQNDQTVVVDA